MISAEAAFERTLKTIKPVLIESGFLGVDERTHPHAFGSRSVTFESKEKFIRLTWDGKDEWFVLESSPASSITFEAGWTDILLRPFKTKSDGDKVIEDISQEIKDSLVD